MLCQGRVGGHRVDMWLEAVRTYGLYFDEVPVLVPCNLLLFSAAYLEQRSDQFGPLTERMVSLVSMEYYLSKQVIRLLPALHS